MSETKPTCPLPIAESEQGLTILKGLLKERSLLAALSLMREHVGPIFQITLPKFQPAVVIGPEPNRELLVSKRQEFSWRNESDPVVKLLRHGVLVVDGEEHDHLRAIMDPPLHRRNVIPHIDVFMDDGATKEEWKMAVETRKIMGGDIAVTATCVRVPVFIGHAEAVNVEFERPIGVDEALAALRDAPGVSVVDHRADEGYVTPSESAGEDAVYVSRIRKDPTVKNGLNLWVVADNLRKGAALNAVQIAEELIRSYMRKAA